MHLSGEWKQPMSTRRLRRLAFWDAQIDLVLAQLVWGLEVGRPT